MSLKKNRSQGLEEPCSDVEEQSKVLELRSSLGDLAGRSLKYCSDDCLKRYLCARNWNVKKAEKMLKESIKWRESYTPEDIRWVQVAKESETGKVFRANFVDKFGRTVLIMHPARQNTTSHDGQIRQLVYCMENAILNLPANREQMVWLIHFHGWTLYKSVPIKTARETANVLQNHFPERLALAILYNPPRIFETFWAIVKPFLDPKTYRKVRFVYTKSPDTVKVLEDLFDMKDLHSSFGGQNPADYNHEEYGKQMQEDDIKTAQYWNICENNVEDPPSISSSNPQAKVHMNGNVVETLGNGELHSRSATDGGLLQIVAGNHGEDSKVFFNGESKGTFSSDNKVDSEAVTDGEATSATV